MVEITLTGEFKSLFEKHPKAAGTFQYGTAGFRMKSTLLDSIMFSVGILAVLRSKSHQGKYVGVMVTASHNPDVDNGVKLVEPLGDMLDQSWEEYAIALANCESPEQMIACINDIVKAKNIDLNANANVLVGRDTRPSGVELVKSLCDGAKTFNVSIVDYGVLTTPQLHYITRCLNTRDTKNSYGEPTKQGYFKKLGDAFKTIVNGKPKLSVVNVDCANGVGAIALKDLIDQIGNANVVFGIKNDNINDSQALNFDCGADYVKMKQTAPKGLTLVPGERYCSLDGDADRIVFYYSDQNNKFVLLDGDKIATLAAGFLMGKIKEANVKRADGNPLRVGVVQTAYANGSATSYVKDQLKVPVVFTATGVKHLHHEAAKFDVGVYFEANGHGTVLFSDEATKQFHQSKGSNEKEQTSLNTLIAFTDLINQTVGDAISDLLMVEAILISAQQTFADWNVAYTDIPSLQQKVKVKDRSNFVTINAETELSHPEGLQAKINALVSSYPLGRAFVRPSGTEDVVRVYAESASLNSTNELCFKICGLVFDNYGGVGERPSSFQ